MQAISLLDNIWPLPCDTLQLLISQFSNSLGRKDVREVSKEMALNNLATDIVNEGLAGSG
jgi:hypothetical protein